jgi:hypothetical protein
MVRPTVPDDVLHVRNADVWIGVVFTKSPNGVKRGGLLGLPMARNGLHIRTGHVRLSGKTDITQAGWMVSSNGNYGTFIRAGLTAP